MASPAPSAVVDVFLRDHVPREQGDRWLSNRLWHFAAVKLVVRKEADWVYSHAKSNNRRAYSLDGSVAHKGSLLSIISQ